MKLSRWGVLLFVVVLMLPASVLAAGKAVVVFEEDFSQYDLGQPPTDWVVGANEGHITVVEAPKMASGRAVRITSDVNRKETNITRDIEMPAGEHKIVIVEHTVRWVAGSSINLYVMKKKNNLNWLFTAAGELGYRMSSGDVKLGRLEDGWNRIRLVADCERDEVYVYLNDMEKAAGGPFSLRFPLDSWQDTAIRIQHSYSATSVLSEAFYGDITVAIVAQ